MREVVGNDVIDLTEPSIVEHHLRERFVARLCAAEERERVATARDLWTLFAAKEAAYKALVKLGGAPGFAHREIRVARDGRVVRWHEQELKLSVVCDDDRVHAVAWSSRSAPPVARVERVAPEDGVPATTATWDRRLSEAARAVLCELLATAIGCGALDLRVVRDPVAGAWDGFGPPRVERRGAAIDADVSLSHDGRFVAAAVLVGRSAP